MVSCKLNTWPTQADFLWKSVCMWKTGGVGVWVGFKNVCMQGPEFEVLPLEGNIYLLDICLQLFSHICQFCWVFSVALKMDCLSLWELRISSLCDWLSVSCKSQIHFAFAKNKLRFDLLGGTEKWKLTAQSNAMHQNTIFSTA